MNIRCIMVIVAVSIALSACGLTPYGDIAREAIRVQGAKIADAGLANAEWFICNAATSGAVYRRYGPHPDLLEAWTVICNANRARQVPINSEPASTGSGAPLQLIPVS